MPLGACSIKDDLEYALLCQSMVSDLGKRITAIGEALEIPNVDAAYKEIGAYIGEVKRLDDKFSRIKPSERMRFHHKSFRAVMDAHLRLAWLLFSSKITTLALDDRALNLALDDLKKVTDKVTVGTVKN